MKRILLGIVLAGTLAGAAQAQSEDSAIAYRKQVMGVIGNHMKSIVNILKGEVEYGDHLQVHAAGLADAAKIALKPFEQEAVFGDKEETTATLAIWEDWDKFSTGMETMEERAAALQQAVASGDKGQIGAAVKELGQACKECHDNFRQK